jgi:hypothetical protein
VVLTVRPLMGRILSGEAYFYQGVLIQCLSYHDDYACPMVERLCQTVMGCIPSLKCLLSGVHGCLRPCPIMPAIQCCWLSWTRPQQLFPMLRAPGYDYFEPEYVLGRVTRRIYSGPTGGEILLVCVYRDEMEDQVIPGSSSI